MKPIFVLILLTMFGKGTLAFADQATTITCTGEYVILTTRTPYLGESSTSTQTLYILKSIENFNESVKTAYFLDVDAEGDVDSDYMIWTVGKNSKGGKFTLKTHFWVDKDDGPIIHQETTGTLTYKHGPLIGKDQIVKCVKY